MVHSSCTRRSALRQQALGLVFVVGISVPSTALGQNTIELDRVTVTGNTEEVERVGPVRGVSTLSGADLRVKTGGTLGETLGGELGVHNASFGPSVGLPVLRGLTGSRVRVMQDGIASHDVSTVSADHASSIEVGIAEQVTIIRGPATLLYGSGASGGAVDVQDNRIPTILPHGLADVVLEPRVATNAHRRSINGRVEGALGSMAYHASGFVRRQGDIDIPDLAIDEPAVREQFGLENRRNSDGFIPNTDSSAEGLSVGVSRVGDWGYAGIAASVQTNEYGLPPGGDSEPPTGTDVHGDIVRIDMENLRIDAKAEIASPLKFLESLLVRAGFVDYSHSEAEQTNPDAGTDFINKALEGRIELHQAPIERSDGTSITGTIGIQALDREFSAEGTETFVPRSDIQSIGGFVLETIERGPWRLEAGFRGEYQRVEQTRALRINNLLVTRTPIEHIGYTASAAIHRRFDRSLSVSLGLTRALRAPDVQELLSLGPHFSTRTFDRGDPKLDQETFWNIDLGIRWQTIWTDLEVNLFYNRVDDFIHQRTIGLFFDAEDGQLRGQCARLNLCFPVTDYAQADATLRGYEINLTFPVVETGWGDIYVDLFSDYVRGRFDDGTDIPRMPPLRIGGALRYERPHWRGDLRLVRVADQNHPGENETTTDGFYMLNASLRHDFPLSAWGKGQVFVRGTNLLDQEARNAVSFLRSFAPEPGRSFELGVRLEF
ncbi:MAG: TonB-dependent receptor [Pseudomonadota bacterium]